MKYTLQENAMSSFHIAIENFKKFFYKSDKYKPSELDESRKLCAIFLENSVELLLKALLVKNDSTSIYSEPESPTIKKAQEEAIKRNIELEDVLVEKGSFKTITYAKTVKSFNDILYHSERTKLILFELSEYRNRLTHFGIKTDDDDEFTIACINVFTVIYQNLFDKIITLAGFEPYFTDDEMLIRTVHGWKDLLDEDYCYNNIVDFLDELVETAPKKCLQYRLKNDKYKIREWCSLLQEVINCNDFKKMLDYYEVSIDWKYSDFTKNDISFELFDKTGLWDSIVSSYCPFYNATTFIGETGLIYFRVLHSSGEIVVYYEGISQPDIEMPQFEEDDWNEHLSNGDSKKYSLTKRNVELAFEKIFKDMEESRANEEKINS